MTLMMILTTEFAFGFLIGLLIMVFVSAVREITFINYLQKIILPVTLEKGNSLLNTINSTKMEHPDNAVAMKAALPSNIRAKEEEINRGYEPLE